MDRATIQEHLKDTIDTTGLQGLGERRVGKVRDVYVQPDRLILVTTDRYSAFDRNLCLVPFKGQVLNLTSAFWFEATTDIVHNHILAVPDPNATVAKKCTVIPLEV